jgi:hypothetical protein
MELFEQSAGSFRELAWNDQRVSGRRTRDQHRKCEAHTSSRLEVRETASCWYNQGAGYSDYGFPLGLRLNSKDTHERMMPSSTTSDLQ